MARKNENSRQSKKVIHIVCEGTHTEPLFFASIRDAILEGVYDIGDCTINIIPKPIISDNIDVPKTPVARGSYQVKKIRRAMKPGETEEGILTGFPAPLNWIRTAQEKLRESISDEAWAIFDKDGHPAMAEAFAAAEEEIDGRTIGIAFSSRSFEYYMLLHFEYIYQEFHATECGERIHGKKKQLKCMLPEAKLGSCQGDRCINGYARSKAYWVRSKSTESMFPLVKDKLNIGIIHAHWLRAESDRENTNFVYERNPYVTTDKLICRLTNTFVYESGQTVVLKYNGVPIQVALLGVCPLMVVNTSETRTVILPEGFFQILNCETNVLTPVKERKELQPQCDDFYQEFCLKQTEIIFINSFYVGSNYILLA